MFFVQQSTRIFISPISSPHHLPLSPSIDISPPNQKKQNFSTTSAWRISPVIKWWMTMMKEGLFPFQMAFSWLIHGGDPNYLPTGMILQMAPPLAIPPGALLGSCLAQFSGDLHSWPCIPCRTPGRWWRPKFPNGVKGCKRYGDTASIVGFLFFGFRFGLIFFFPCWSGFCNWIC